MSWLEGLQDLLGGGTMTIWLILGGILMAWMAWKAARFVVRLFAAAVAVALLLGTAPWSGEALAGGVADCIIEDIYPAMTLVERFATKRMTVERLEAGTQCRPGTGVTSGSAEVELRTVFDVPFQTLRVSPLGVDRSVDIP